MARKNVIGLVLVLASVGLLVWAFEAPAQQPPLDPKMVEMYDRFIEIVNRVQKDYVHEVDTKKLFENAINGMLSGLDPFSNYIPEEELNEFQKATRGKFGGIGIQIGQRNGLLTVISPLEDTPAFKAGLLSGDVIVEVDGKNSEKMRLEEAVKLLTGEPGTTVRLKVRHMTGDLQEFTITRAIIEVQTVKGLKRDDKDQWVYWIDPERKIAYVRLTQFAEASATDLKKVLTQLNEEGMKGLILDLRFDPGGILKVATDICEMFVNEGVIVQVKARNTTFPPATASGKAMPFVPMVVLLNPFSASASEIVAGCLQDHHRAILVGERSFGKGSVQNVISLDDNKAALKLTTAKYYLPSGRCIHRDEDMTDKDEWGVVPDIIVAMTPEEYIGIIRARQEAEVLHKGNGTQPKTDAPKSDAPKTDAPKTDAPKSDAPKTDAPKTDAPKSDAPKTDAPKTETPKTDKPKTDKSTGEPVMPSGDDEEVPAGAKPLPKPIKPSEDRQLMRAVDILHAADVLEKYLNKEPVKQVEMKPRETKKAA
jgi:carboxyl-terminal processing protease